MTSEAQFESQSAENLAELEAIGREETAKCAAQAGPELKLIDAGISCLLGLYIEPMTLWKAEGLEAVWTEIETPRASPTLVFATLLASIANSVLATRRLAIEGLDRQARTVFRELAETGDALLAFLGDREFARRYYESPEGDDEARKHWSKKLRPWQIHAIVERLVRETAADPETMEETLHERRALYAWLSKAAHIDYAGLFLSGVSSDFGAKYELNIGGITGPHTLATLARLCSQLDFLLTFTGRLLHERHGWQKPRTDFVELLEPIALFERQYLAWFGSGRPKELTE